MPQEKAAHLTVDFEVKLASGASDGTFSGYGSVFENVDYGGDAIKKGATVQSLKDWKSKGKMPKMLLQHGGGYMGSAEDMLPIGSWTHMEEDNKGLLVEGKLIALDTDRGKTIYAGLKEGVLDGLSIGYRAKEFTLGTKPDEPYRTIKRLDLMEVSVVLFGMNDKALIDAVKSADIDGLETLSDCEKLLRDAAAGMSRKSATAFVSKIAHIAKREAGAKKSMDALLEQIRSVNRSF